MLIEKKANKNFTLIELIVVVIILSIFAQLIIGTLDGEKDEVFFEKNQKSLLAYRKALVGSKKSFLRDLGRLPYNLKELFVPGDYYFEYNYEYGWDGPYIDAYDMPLTSPQRLLANYFKFNVDDENFGWRFEEKSDSLIIQDETKNKEKEKKEYPPNNTGRKNPSYHAVVEKDFQLKKLRKIIFKVRLHNKSDRVVPNINHYIPTEASPNLGEEEKQFSYRVRLALYYPDAYDIATDSLKDKEDFRFNKAFAINSLAGGEKREYFLKSNYGQKKDGRKEIRRTRVIFYLIIDDKKDEAVHKRILADYEPIEIDLTKEKFPSELNFYAHPYIISPQVNNDEVKIEDIAKKVSSEYTISFVFSRYFSLALSRAGGDDNKIRIVAKGVEGEDGSKIISNTEHKFLSDYPTTRQNYSYDYEVPPDTKTIEIYADYLSSASVPIKIINLTEPVKNP